ncbi:hypothetical protein K435DRAFT_566851, partial [Dendrothele bispora CBS 962.96]
VSPLGTESPTQQVSGGSTHDHTSPTPTFALDCCGWPGWMVAAADYLEPQAGTMGEIWSTLLEEWNIFERWHDFENPKNACYTAAGRPPIVGVWFKGGKRFRALTPKEALDGKIKDLDKTWPLWWSTINPDWRERDNTNKIVLGSDGQGDWLALNKLGPCGILLVIMCLVWWKQLLSDQS